MRLTLRIPATVKETSSGGARCWTRWQLALLIAAWLFAAVFLALIATGGVEPVVGGVVVSVLGFLVILPIALAGLRRAKSRRA